MTSTLQKYLAPQQPKHVEPKPTISERLCGLFGKVNDLDRDDRQSKVDSYDSLVQRLADADLNESGRRKLPDTGEIRTVLAASGRSADDLQTAVARTVRIHRLRSVLMGEVAAIEARGVIAKQTAEHKVEFDQFVTKMQAKGDQLEAERREVRSTLESFGRTREQLHRLATAPSARELHLDEEIKSLLKREGTLRARSGQVPLLERYITGTSENSREWKELQELEGEIKNLEAARTETTRPGPRRQKMLDRRDELAATVEGDERRYDLGSQVRECKQSQAVLVAERDQLKCERLAAIETGDTK